MEAKPSEMGEKKNKFYKLSRLVIGCWVLNSSFYSIASFDLKEILQTDTEQYNGLTRQKLNQ